MDRGQRRPCAMTECQIASRLSLTNSVNKNFVSTLTERDIKSHAKTTKNDSTI